jgi:hypothetical protein
VGWVIFPGIGVVGVGELFGCSLAMVEGGMGVRFRIKDGGTSGGDKCELWLFDCLWVPL